MRNSNSLSDGRGDYRVHLQHHDGGSSSSGDLSNTVGCFYRDNEGLAVVLGTLDNPKNRQELRCVTLYVIPGVALLGRARVLPNTQRVSVRVFIHESHSL